MDVVRGQNISRFWSKQFIRNAVTFDSDVLSKYNDTDFVQQRILRKMSPIRLLYLDCEFSVDFRWPLSQNNLKLFFERNYFVNK